MNLGIHKETIELYEHDIMWEKIAKYTINELKEIFGATAIDIQHIESTAINNIKVKPIIDIVAGIKNFDDFIKLKYSMLKHEFKG